MTSGAAAGRLGFVGAGQMAQALAAGVAGSGLFSDPILASDPSPAAREQFRHKVRSARLVTDNGEVFRQADVVVVAVKPQHLEQALDSVTAASRQSPLVISIAAGVTLERLCRLVQTRRVVRVMPNTPCLVGYGAAAYAVAEDVSEADGQLVESLFRAVGMVVGLPEGLLDAVTGLSGSGPGFVYEVIDALADGGVHAGLSRSVALQLAAHTVRGAAEMVLQTGEHPGVLRDRVVSPGGTTSAGLYPLHQSGLRGILISGVLAATRRSQELGQQSGR